MRQIPFVLLLLGLLALPVLASPEAMVTRLTEGGEVVVNRGVEDQVTPGTHWYVYRNGKPVAELEVELVDSYTSKARVVQGSGVQVGDKVTDKAFTTAPVPAAVETPVAASTPAGAATPASAATPAAGRTATPSVTAGDAQKSYDKLLAGATRTHTFKGGAQASTDIKIDPLNTLNMFTTFGYGGQYWMNPWNIISVTGAGAATNVANSTLYKDNQLQIQVTWWNEALLEGYADSMALRENKSSVEDRLAMRASLFAQKGLDRYHVFHVRLANRGPGTVQVSPFHWHMYLTDAQGNRVKADRYDQVLDRTLNPDQTVEGSIYFMKVDVAGRPILPPGKVKVVLEDILGERAEMSF